MNKIFTMYFDDFENILIEESVKNYTPLVNLIPLLEKLKYLKNALIPKYLTKIKTSKIQSLEYYTDIISKMFEEFCNEPFLKLFFKSFIEYYLQYMLKEHKKKEMFRGILYILKEKGDEKYYRDFYEEPLFDNVKQGSICFLDSLSINLNSIIMLFDVFSDNTFDDYIKNKEKIFLFKNLFMASSEILDDLPISKNIFLVKQDNIIMSNNIFREKYLHIKESLKDINNYSQYLQSINSRIDDIVKSINNIDILYISTYQVYNIFDYINVCISYIVKNNVVIKKCKNCNQLFIPESRTDEVYCNRTSPQNPSKTCKEYGAKKTYRDEIKSTPIKYEHNKTSQFFRMRINRTSKDNTKEKEMYQKKFNTYKENYQKKKEQYQSGKLKEKDFVEWIIKQKEGVKNGSTRNNKK